MPNFFRGPGVDPTAFPPDTPEKMARITAFIQGPANIERGVETLQMVMEKVMITYPSVEKWGAVGYCWGGKVCVSDSSMPSSKTKDE